MSKWPWLAIAGLNALWMCAQAARAQSYIGFVYPAGGRQGTTFRVSMGGQGVEGVDRVYVSGAGVTGRVVEYNKRLGAQEVKILNEQMQELKRALAKEPDPAHTNLIARLEKLLGEHVNQPACAAIANLIVAEITIAPEAEPGLREIRVGTPKGLSNPLVFCVGHLPEVAEPPLPTSPLVVLGKEARSRRKIARQAPFAQGGSEMTMMASIAAGAGGPDDSDGAEAGIVTPCVVNGQVAQGSVDRYFFEALKGQRLVLAVQARELVPFMADAVPGWFQPVLAVKDAGGREVAYKDDYRFKPDPVVLFEVPADGRYQFAIHDAIYRGREDFVYRVTVGELPFITGIFPLGGCQGAAAEVTVNGWNLAADRLSLAGESAAPSVCQIAAPGKGGLLSNRVPFAWDALPACLEKEPNSQRRTAQRVTPPVIVNGRIDKPGDKDIFQFEGRAGDEIVAEVVARRLDSPLDSVLKLTDSAGRSLALNDDREDAGAGLNTHHADSYVRASLPTNGVFFLHLGDTQHNGGGEYAYRLRISAPRPDFALRIVPSSAVIRSNAPAYPTVHIFRKDGFSGPIKLVLKDPPAGITMADMTVTGTQTMAKVGLRTRLLEMEEPVSLTIEGAATNGGQRIVRAAVPAEDRMQAFLWRHLVPAQEFKAVVRKPSPSKKNK